MSTPADHRDEYDPPEVDMADEFSRDDYAPARNYVNDLFNNHVNTDPEPRP